MTARDDFPVIPNGSKKPGDWWDLHARLCDEVDRLRRENAELSTALSRGAAIKLDVPQ